MLDKFFGGKPWFKSLTGWALFIFIMAQTAIPTGQEAGIIDMSTAETLNGWMNSAAMVMGALGIRRRLPS